MRGVLSINGWRTTAKGLKREVHALCLCSRHPKTPLYAKLFALLIVGYALSPIDLIPDFIPVLGYVDDLVLIPFGVILLIRLMPEDVLEECRRRARSAPVGKSMGWAGAVVVVCVWALSLCVALRLVAWVIRS
jgi:uncharacterized membrane protein YkvA (DUF1232 family)